MVDSSEKIASGAKKPEEAAVCGAVDGEAGEKSYVRSEGWKRGLAEGGR